MGLIMGTVLGFLSGLGIGGGSLLILYLTQVAGMSQEAARSINLLFYLPCAGIAAALRWRSVEFGKLLSAIITGCIGAAVCSLAAANADVELLQKWFGWLLLITGVREIFYRPRQNTFPRGEGGRA